MTLIAQSGDKLHDFFLDLITRWMAPAPSDPVRIMRVVGVLIGAADDHASVCGKGHFAQFGENWHHFAHLPRADLGTAPQPIKDIRLFQVAVSAADG